MANTILWADIPVADMARAKKFYGEMLQVEMLSMPGAEDSVAIPGDGGEGDISFDLVKYPGYEPADQGTRIYFDPKGDIDGMIARAVAAGGTLVQAPQDMGPVVGIIAFLTDTEGNRFGLRAPSAQSM